LWKITGALSARLGAGTGYKIPIIFTSAAEGRAFHDVLPVATTLQAETSRGVNLDLSDRFVAGDMIISVNQAFYYTRLLHPLVPSPGFLQRGLLAYENAASPLISKGLDTNLHVALEETELYVDYTYTKVQANDSAAGLEAELTPEHKLNLDLVIEAEQSWRAGFEAFYIGRQYLGNQTWSRDFWLIGLMLQKTFGDVAIIGNVENAFDVRQSRYEKVVLPPYNHPTFRPLYAPLDGVVANAALEIKIR
jgi:outer membrane receptor for ferrienterochelin and colicins